MSFFDSIISAIQSPQLAGTNQDLQSLANLAGLIPGLQGNEQQIQPILNVLGPYLQDALNEQKASEGAGAAQQTVTKLSQPGGSVQDREKKP